MLELIRTYRLIPFFRNAIPGYRPAKSRPERTPAQSLEFLKKTVRDIFPDVPDPVLLKMLG